jgi:4-hydroxy 2-oxovalerate aldolase
MFDTAVASGVDYIELGYKASKHIFSPDEFGPWKFCEEDDIRRIVGDNPTGIKISVMADAERTDYHTDILPKSESVIECVRVACYINQIPIALDMVKDAHDKGYETMLQLMAVSIVPEDEIRAALDLVARSPAAGVYLVDSFGALYSEQVRKLTLMYKAAMEGTGKEVGFHGHNNMQLAFANTIEALISGANRLDATISGLGRGAGNCPMELILGFLHNPKFNLRPVLECCRDVFVPLAAKMDWGYSIPYATTGRLNRHPREAMKWRAGDTPDDYVAFYDAMFEEPS